MNVILSDSLAAVCINQFDLYISDRPNTAKIINILALPLDQWTEKMALKVALLDKLLISWIYL